MNRRTYDVIASFGADEAPSAVVTDFLCECGCLTYVAVPLERYVDSGAWIDEHRESAA